MLRQKISANILILSQTHIRLGKRGTERRVPIDVLADLMGHEKIETTRKYYISDNFESKELQREKINQMWK